jgi:translation elongation factor EF-Tu-like GTPase
MIPRKPDFIAKLKFFTSEQGGRRTAAKSGYRPQVKFDFTEMQTSGQQIFIDREIVNPGETVIAEITLLSPQLFLNQLWPGMEYEFREGPNIIGTGEIIEILNSDLEKKNSFH